MTFQEFRRAVSEIAGRRYHSATVEVSTSSGLYSAPQSEIVWRAYIGSDDTRDVVSIEGPTPEGVIIELRGATDADVEQIGEVA